VRNGIKTCECATDFGGEFCQLSKKMEELLQNAYEGLVDGIENITESAIKLEMTLNLSDTSSTYVNTSAEKKMINIVASTIQSLTVEDL
jgi:hypothetical protein